MHPEGEVNRGLCHLFLSRQEVAGNLVRKGKTFATDTFHGVLKMKHYF